MKKYWLHFRSEYECSVALALFSAFSFITIVFGWSAGLETANWASVYFGLASLILLAVAILGVRLGSGPLTNQSTIKNYFSWNGLIGLFAFFFYLAPNFFRFSPWFDETTQFFLAVSPQDSFGVTDFAAIQQQPPLGYYFSQFFRLTLGNHTAALRFPVIVFSFFLILSMSRYADRIGKHPLFFLIWISFFLVQAEHAQYFIESRPIILGIFLSFMIFQRFDEWLEGNPRLWFELLAWSTLLLFSLGYQSCFFLILLPLARFFEIRKKRLWSAFLFVTILPGLLCSIVWLRVFLLSITVDQFRLDQPYSSYLARVMFHFENLGQFAEAGGFLILLIAVFLLIRIGDESKKQWLENLIPFGVYLVLFPLLVLVTWGFIKWGLFPKYYLLWISGLYFFCLRLLPAKKIFWGKLGAALALILLFSFWFFPTQVQRLKFQFLEHPDWMSVANYLEKRAKIPHGFAYVSLSKKESAKFDYLTGRLFSTENSIWLYPCLSRSGFCAERDKQMKFSNLSDFYLIIDFLEMPIPDHPLFRGIEFISNKQAVIRFNTAAEMNQLVGFISSTGF